MAQLITREELALVLDETISPERFVALYNQGLRIVSTGYADPESATGRAAEIVSGVLFGVLARIVSNPKGARQLVGGPASVTFGGSDVEIASIFTLTDQERADLFDAATPGGVQGGGAFTIRPGRP
jgi:hypothetical protein